MARPCQRETSLNSDMSFTTRLPWLLCSVVKTAHAFSKASEAMQTRLAWSQVAESSQCRPERFGECSSISNRFSWQKHVPCPGRTGFSSVYLRIWDNFERFHPPFQSPSGPIAHIWYSHHQHLPILGVKAAPCLYLSDFHQSDDLGANELFRAHGTNESPCGRRNTNTTSHLELGGTRLVYEPQWVANTFHTSNICTLHDQRKPVPINEEHNAPRKWTTTCLYRKTAIQGAMLPCSTPMISGSLSVASPNLGPYRWRLNGSMINGEVPWPTAAVSRPHWAWTAPQPWEWV